MSKYLKMADVFDLPILGSRAEFFPLCLNESSAMIAAHAINSHDELVVEVGSCHFMRLACCCQLGFQSPSRRTRPATNASSRNST